MIHHRTEKRNEWGGDSEPSLVSSSPWKRDFQDGEVVSKVKVFRETEYSEG